MNPDITFPHLRRYTRPPNFADFSGLRREEYFEVAGQHRDSDSLTRANFASVLRALGGESETVLVLRDSHWAVGWVEGIYIHESDHERLQIADRIREKLEDYPVVDEDTWSDLQWTEAAEAWNGMSLRERIDCCRRFRCSIFAARRDELPEDPQEMVDYLVDGC